MSTKKGSYGMFCHCCGADITAPQFYNGEAYGWSCVLKQFPDFKRTRNVGFWVKADSVEFTKDTDSNRFTIVAILNGVKFSDSAYIDLDHYNETGEERPMFRKNIKGGLIRISEHNNGKGCLWNGITVNTEMDSKHKTYPVNVESYGRNNSKVLWKIH
jgi:hypothetical protein